MKFSFSQAIVLAALALLVYAFGARGLEIMIALKNWFQQEMRVQTPLPPARVLVPLANQIPVCRKERSGFQSCMFSAGYAVNEAWKSAHDKDPAGPSGKNDFGRAAEVTNDPYRPGASPTYGVPYWVPRDK